MALDLQVHQSMLLHQVHELLIFVPKDDLVSRWRRSQLKGYCACGSLAWNNAASKVDLVLEGVGGKVLVVGAKVLPGSVNPPDRACEHRTFGL